MKITRKQWIKSLVSSGAVWVAFTGGVWVGSMRTGWLSLVAAGCTMMVGQIILAIGAAYRIDQP